MLLLCKNALCSNLKKHIVKTSTNVVRTNHFIQQKSTALSITTATNRIIDNSVPVSFFLTNRSNLVSGFHRRVVMYKFPNAKTLNTVIGSGKRYFTPLAACTDFLNLQDNILLRKRKKTCSSWNNSSYNYKNKNSYNLMGLNTTQLRHFSLEDRRREREARRRKRRHTSYAEPDEERRTRTGTVSRVDTEERDLHQQGRRGNIIHEEEEKLSAIDAMDVGQAAYLRKVYMYTGSTIGIASIGAFGGMLFPISPLIPGLLALVPLIGLYYTGNKPDSSPALRLGLLGGFGFLSGMSAGPLIAMSLHMDPLILPMALLGSCGIFGGATLASLAAKEGSLLKMGAPLGGLVFALLGLQIVGLFYPHPMIWNINLYGGLALFTAFVAYDTHQTLEDYKCGQRDALTHAANFFINFMAIFKRLLFIFMSRDD